MMENDDDWLPVKNRSQNRQTSTKKGLKTNNIVSPSHANVDFRVPIENGYSRTTPYHDLYPDSGNVTGNSYSSTNTSSSSPVSAKGHKIQLNLTSNGDRRQASLKTSQQNRTVLDKEVRNEAVIKNNRWLFEEELKKSEERLKRAFSEMRDRLNQREKELSLELEKCKIDGHGLLDSQEQLEQQLKAQSRGSTVNNKDVEELRQKVKKFAYEKCIDDLGRVIRFQYEPDKLIASINTFGEVQAVMDRSLGRKSPSVISVDGCDISSVDSTGCNNNVSKPVVSEINVGGLVIQSDSMDPAQLADITRQLQESLKLQGITEDIMPEVTSSLTCLNGSMPHRKRPMVNKGRVGLSQQQVINGKVAGGNSPGRRNKSAKQKSAV